jgi:hypothetical protein
MHKREKRAPTRVLRAAELTVGQQGGLGVTQR